MSVSAFPAQLLYAQTHYANCISEIMKRQCKAIPTFGFTIHHCRVALLTLPHDGEYYGSAREIVF